MQREPDSTISPSSIGCLAVFLGSLVFFFVSMHTLDAETSVGGVLITKQNWTNWTVLSMVAYTLGFFAYIFPRFALPLLLIGGLSAIAADLLGFFSTVTTGIGVLMLVGAFYAFQLRRNPFVVYPYRPLALLIFLPFWLVFMLTLQTFGTPVTPMIFQTVGPSTTTVTHSTPAPTSSPNK
jgi:hypothetical protein